MIEKKHTISENRPEFVEYPTDISAAPSWHAENSRNSRSYTTARCVFKWTTTGYEEDPSVVQVQW